MIIIMWGHPTEGHQMLVFAKIGKNFDMWCFLTRFFVVGGMLRGEKVVVGRFLLVMFPALADRPSFKKWGCRQGNPME